MIFNLWQNTLMKKSSYYFCLVLLLVSCSESSDLDANKGPSFGFHVDRIVRANEGQIEIGTFAAIDAEGDAISYSISNTDMSIDDDALVTFNTAPDFETQAEYTAVITASNDGGSDEINLTVYINDSDCEFDTAAALDACVFK